MRIAFDAKRAYNNARGLGQYARQLLIGLRELDQEMSLYTSGKNQVWTFPEFNDPKVEVVKKSGLLGAYWRRSRLGRQAEKSGAQVFHGLSNELPADIPQTLPSVVTIHDLLFLDHPYLYPLVDRLIYKQKVRQALETADVVAVTSDAVKNSIKHFFPAFERKLHKVYQCADPVFFSSAEEDFPLPLPDSFVLCVGAIEARKNQLSLLKGMVEAKLDLPLVLVGNGKRYWKDIQFWARQNHWDKRILQVSGISNAQLATLYRKATLLAYPSLNEGFGIPLVEAMATGTPILTSNGEVFQEVCGEAAVYIDPQQPSSIAAGLKVIQEPQKRAELTLFGKQRSKAFTRASFASQMLEIYKSLS